MTQPGAADLTKQGIAVVAKIVTGTLIMVALLAGCGGPSEALAPTTASTTCAQQAAAFIAQIEPLQREWDDASTLANTTPRASLSGQIDKLQAIRRKTEDLQAPDCAAAAKQPLVTAMDATVRGYIAFLGQKPDSEVNPLFVLAKDQTDTFKQAIQALKAGNTAPTHEPALTDGLGVTQAAIQGVYQKDGLTFENSPLSDGRPRSLGDMQDAFIELIGPPENVRQASIFATMKGGGQDQLNRTKEMLRTFLRTVASDWEEGDAWLTTAMDTSGEPQTRVTRGRVVTYKRSAASGDDTFSLVVQVP